MKGSFAPLQISAGVSLLKFPRQLIKVTRTLNDTACSPELESPPGELFFSFTTNQHYRWIFQLRQAQFSQEANRVWLRQVKVEQDHVVPRDIISQDRN